MPASSRDVKLTPLQLECLKVLARQTPRPFPKKRERSSNGKYYLVSLDLESQVKSVYLASGEYDIACKRSVSARLRVLKRRGFLVDLIWGQYHLWLPGPMMDALRDHGIIE